MAYATTTVAVALMAAVLSFSLPTRATPYRLSPRERVEIERMLRAFFEAIRDGHTTEVTAHLPTPDEFRQIFRTGTEPFVQRHQQALERDVRELRQHFAHGVWLGLSFTHANTVEVSPCGRFALPTSQCIDGPVISWRTGDAIHRLRIDRLVRIHGRWKIFDARL